MQRKCNIKFGQNYKLNMVRLAFSPFKFQDKQIKYGPFSFLSFFQDKQIKYGPFSFLSFLISR